MKKMMNLNQKQLDKMQQSILSFCTNTERCDKCKRYYIIDDLITFSVDVEPDDYPFDGIIKLCNDCSKEFIKNKETDIEIYTI